MLQQFERDLEIVAKALEQSLANHNVLIGQKQALEHVIAKVKADAQTVEKVADVAETIVEAIPESTAS